MGICQSKQTKEQDIANEIVNGCESGRLKPQLSEGKEREEEEAPENEAPKPPLKEPDYNIEDQEFYKNIINGETLLKKYDYKNRIPLYENGITSAKEFLINLKNEYNKNEWETYILKWEGIIIELKLEYKKLLEKQEKRNKAINELIKTEQNYINSIKFIINQHAEPLKNDKQYKNILSDEEYKLLFDSIKDLIKLNEEFLSELTLNTKNDEIGANFTKITENLEMYENYMDNYSKVMEETLPNLISKNSKFNQFINVASFKCENKPLQLLLILPIQRIFKYELCLKEIIKYTEEYHSDFVDLNESYDLIEKTTHLLNQRMQEHEARIRILQIEKQFNNKIKLVEPFRYFIKMGVLNRIHKSGKEEELYFIVFNDCIITANGKNEDNLKYKDKYPIDTSFIVKDNSRDSDKNKTNTMFEIHTTKKSFYCVAKNEKEKDSWVTTLEHLMDEMKKKGAYLNGGPRGSKTLKTPLSWVDVCEMKNCNTKFSMINRKHHCSSCGKIVCNKHCKHKLINKITKDKNNDNTNNNVCDDCFQLL